MNRAAASSLLISLALFALSTAAAAQSTQPNTPLVITQGAPFTVSPQAEQALRQMQHQIQVLASGSCPVGLRAQPGVGSGMVIVVTGNDTASQKLNLQFSNPSGVGVITHAQITVHGLTAQGRISPAAFGDPDTATIATQVDLELTVAAGSRASRDLLFKGFTSVRWIDLDSLTYADGSTWHASPHHNCQIVPDRFMLVASH